MNTINTKQSELTTQFVGAFASFVYPRTSGGTAESWTSAAGLARLPDGQLFNAEGVEAFNRARQEALAGGLDIVVIAAMQTEAQVPLYPFRGRRSSGAHHSTHHIERGAIGIDIDKWWQVKDILEKHGFRWRNHPHHPGHFDYLGSPV